MSNFAWWYSLSFPCAYHFQWPGLYFKVTSVSNNFNWKFEYSYLTNMKLRTTIISSTRSWIYHYFWLSRVRIYISWFDTPWPPQPSPLVEGPYATYDLWHQFYGWQQWSTSRLHQQIHRQSYSIWNRSQHRKDQDHDQQHEQHQCRYLHELPEVRGGDHFQVPGSNPVQRWHLLKRNPHQDCFSNG